MPAIVSWENRLEQAGVSLATDSEAPGLGIQAVLTPQLLDAWRSGPWGATTITHRFDLGRLAPDLRLFALGADRTSILPSGGIPGTPDIPAIPGIPAVAGPPGGAVSYLLKQDLGALLTESNARLAAEGAQAAASGFLLRQDYGFLLTEDARRIVAEGGASYPGTPGTPAIPGQPPSGTLIRITASAVAVDGTDALDTGPQPFTMAPYGVWAWLAGSMLAARHVTIRMLGTSADPYLQLGRAWIGPALVTRWSIAYGWKRGGRDAGTSVRSATSGARFASPGARTRTAAFELPRLTPAEADALEACALAVGTTGQVFVAPLGGRPSAGMFGSFSAYPEVAQPGFQRFSAPLTVEEDT